MTKKKAIAMILVMVVITLIYLATSGVFTVNSSFQDVMSNSEAKTITEDGLQWQFNVPDDADLTPYFTFSGDKSPKHTVSIRAVYYEDVSGKRVRKVYDGYMIYDKHFFFGEPRWYFSVNGEGANIKDVYCKIGYREYATGEMYIDYIYSKGLTEKEKEDCKNWTDSEELTELNLPA